MIPPVHISIECLRGTPKMTRVAYSLGDPRARCAVKEALKDRFCDDFPECLECSGDLGWAVGRKEEEAGYGPDVT